MSNPTFGYLASLVSPKKTRVALHTAPAGKVVEGKISITHKDPYPIRVRIGVSSGGLQTSTLKTISYLIMRLVKVRVMKATPSIMVVTNL